LSHRQGIDYLLKNSCRKKTNGQSAIENHSFFSEKFGAGEAIIKVINSSGKKIPLFKTGCIMFTSLSPFP
jgi:hypothetical protein